jgi:hypothetical protein
MKCYHQEKEDCEGEIGHSQVHDNITKQSSVASVTLEIIGIQRHEMTGHASSTQPSLAVEVATQLVILLRNVWIYFSIPSKTT